MLEIKQTDLGVSFLVRVIPRAAKDALAEPVDGALKVRLAAPPVEGAANKALLRFLAKVLGVAKSNIHLVSGEKSRNKRIEVLGIDSGDLVRKLEV